MEKNTHNTGYIPALTGLRGVAAMAIVAVHLALPPSFASRYDFLMRLKELCWIGVPIFFVLSGYLITWLALKEMNATGGFKLMPFYMRRIIRIWPLYFTVCGLALWVGHGHSPIPRIFGTDPSWTWPLLTFTTNFAVRARGNWDGIGHLLPLWTLAFEEQFYLGWGLVLRWLPRKYLFPLAVVLTVGVSWGYRIVIPIDNPVIYRMHFGVGIGTLMTGCILALAEEHIRKLLPPPPVLLAGVLICLLVLAKVEWPFPTTSFKFFMLLTAVDIVSACIIMLATAQTGVVKKFLSLRPMIHLGNVSYCTYVIHLTVLAFYYWKVMQYPAYIENQLRWPLFSVIKDYLMAGTLVVSLSTLWTLAERPVQRLRYRFRQA